MTVFQGLKDSRGLPWVGWVIGESPDSPAARGYRDGLRKKAEDEAALASIAKELSEVDWQAGFELGCEAGYDAGYDAGIVDAAGISQEQTDRILAVARKAELDRDRRGVKHFGVGGGI